MGNIWDMQLKQAAKLSLAEYIIFNEKIFRLQRYATYRTNSNANEHILLTKEALQSLVECPNTVQTSLQV